MKIDRKRVRARQIKAGERVEAQAAEGGVLKNFLKARRP
jgi:hypothetical protein